MRPPIGNEKDKAVDLADMYALKIGALWKALKQEPASLWMLCIYFFFEYVRPQSLYPVLDVLPWGQVFLIASVITAFTDREVSWTVNTLNKFFIFFIIIVILSGIFAFRPTDALDYWEVMGSWFLVYFLVITVVNTEKRMLLFLLAYCLFNFKMAQHGAVAWAQRGFSFASYGLVGSPGWFRNSGEYAIQMLIFGPIALALVVSLKDYWGKYKKFFLYLAATTGYMAVVGASSRGAQIGLAAVGVWFLLKQKNGVKGLLAMMVLGVLLYYFIPEEQMLRFKDMGEDGNSLQRLAYWEYGLFSVVPDNPVLGVGYHNWLSYLYYSVPEGLGPSQKIQQPHNIYIQAASELGVMGLTIFLLMSLFAFVNNARTRRLAKTFESKLEYNLSYAFDAGLIGYLVAGTFVTVLYYPFFWVQMAMIVMLNNVTKKKFELTQTISQQKEIMSSG